MPLMQTALDDPRMASRVYIGVTVALTFSVGILWNWWRLYRNKQQETSRINQADTHSAMHQEKDDPRSPTFMNDHGPAAMLPQMSQYDLNEYADNRSILQIKIASRTPTKSPSEESFDVISPVHPPTPTHRQTFSRALSDALSRASSIARDASRRSSFSFHRSLNSPQNNSRTSRAPSLIPFEHEDINGSLHESSVRQSHVVGEQQTFADEVFEPRPTNTEGRSVFDPYSAPFQGFGMWAPDERRSRERRRSRSRRRRYRRPDITLSPGVPQNISRTISRSSSAMVQEEVQLHVTVPTENAPVPHTVATQSPSPNRRSRSRRSRSSRRPRSVLGQQFLTESPERLDGSRSQTRIQRSIVGNPARLAHGPSVSAERNVLVAIQPPDHFAPISSQQSSFLVGASFDTTHSRLSLSHSWNEEVQEVTETIDQDAISRGRTRSRAERPAQHPSTDARQGRRRRGRHRNRASRGSSQPDVVPRDSSLSGDNDATALSNSRELTSSRGETGRRNTRADISQDNFEVQVDPDSALLSASIVAPWSRSDLE